MPQNPSPGKSSPSLIFYLLPDSYSADWQDFGQEPDEKRQRAQQTVYQTWLLDPARALYEMGFADPAVFDTASTRYLASLARLVIRQLAQRPEREFLREKISVGLSAEEASAWIEQAPFMNGSEYLTPDWLNLAIQRMLTVFATEVKDYPGTVAEYLSARHAAVMPAGRVFFHLVENRQSSQPFAFLATYASGADAAGQASHLPLAHALRAFRQDQPRLMSLLSTVYRSAERSVLIRDLLDTGDIFQPIGLEVEEAYTFLREIPLYEESGIVCRMPDWWKRRTSTARVAVQIGNQQPSRIGLDSLIDFQVSLVLGDLELTAEELHQMLADTEGLVLIKGRWIEVDHAKLQTVLQAYERIRGKLGSRSLGLAEALRYQLQADKDLDADPSDSLVEISQGHWLQDFMKQLSVRSGLAGTISGHHLQAQLRPYQSVGLNWLHQMKQLRLGACLADDMGLGKTIQVIALLDAVQTRQREKNLLVVPASLIGNWRRELDRFAPGLQVAVLHPSEKDNLCSDEPDTPPSGLGDPIDLVITTYGMLERYPWLKHITWDTLVLDEAQAIKNPATRQTRAVKQIPAHWRVALTGTPVENRLTDLWSLFDFLNKGMLGTPQEFGRFSSRLDSQQSGYARLKQVLSPFILRRLKTDRAIISDLPDKIEMKTYASLSKKQLALYASLVEDLKERLLTAGSGMERRGAILSAIVKFKQICNHPDQYLGQRQYQEKDSGKFARLREICETIEAKRERVLVFTQFQEMTGPLQAFLEDIFAHRGLVLHGQTPVAKRRQIIETFQGSAYVPFLVLSLKAGGVGLNLTQANHVIHFDRWWNPAVENQATDRAFRIGQQKNVIVHKFMTRGTIEEKIDKMIEDKMSLARDIVPDKQETWITEMDDRQLMDLFQLSV